MFSLQQSITVARMTWIVVFGRVTVTSRRCKEKPLARCEGPEERRKTALRLSVTAAVTLLLWFEFVLPVAVAD